jgi:SRSO17 transposase
MGGRVSGDSESRFAAYVEGLSTVIGHADRAGPLRDYCVGLMMPGERKSVEPMAAVTAPARTAAQHQSLLHFVGQSAWSDTEVLAKVGEMVLPKIEHHGAIEAWIIDDTGFAKKGEHSVGVARQYCGRLGKTDNCQVAVSLSLANHHASLPVAYQLYLPEEWSNDRKRLRKAGVPEDVGFKTKPEIALEQIAAACAAGLPRGVVLMDAAYGNNSGQAGAGHPSGCDVTPNINRSRSRNWRLACPTAHGEPSCGAKAAPNLYLLALPACEFMLHGAILRAARAGRKNGC